MGAKEDFIAAIAGQESGGNYGAVNGRTGASGKYQVMPANVPSWSKQVLGYSITLQQFRSSPDLQEKIVRGVLGGYYDKYGARGAASCWYSGNPSGQNNYTRFRSNEPSIGEYCDSVLKRIKVGSGTNYDSALPASPSVAQAPVQTPSASLGGYGAGIAATEPLGLGAATEASGTGVASFGSQALSASTDALPGASGGLPSPSAGLSGAGAKMRQAVLDFARQQIGTPYVWGGASFGKAVDCSGLVMTAMAKAGLTVPRIAAAQLSTGKRMDVSQLQPGDLIGWGTGQHVAFYLGNNQILEAPRTGLNVRIRDLGDGWDKKTGYWGVSMSNLYGG